MKPGKIKLINLEVINCTKFFLRKWSMLGEEDGKYSEKTNLTYLISKIKIFSPPLIGLNTNKQDIRRRAHLHARKIINKNKQTNKQTWTKNSSILYNVGGKINIQY